MVHYFFLNNLLCSLPKCIFTRTIYSLIAVSTVNHSLISLNKLHSYTLHTLDSVLPAKQITCELNSQHAR